MRNKICAILFCLMPVLVLADNADTVIINKMNTIINRVNYEYTDVSNEYEFLIKYSSNPNTYFINVYLNNYINTSFNNNNYSYKGNISSIKTDDAFTHNLNVNDKSSDKIIIGEEDYLINDSFTFNDKYLINYEKNDVYKYQYDQIIANEDYVIKSLNFVVYLPPYIKESDILFSLDGNKYYNSINGLNYTYEDGYLNGKISNLRKTLFLRVKCEDGFLKYENFNADFSFIITFVSLICLFITIIVFVIFKRKNRKHNI